MTTVNQVVDGTLKLIKATNQLVLQPGGATANSVTFSSAAPAVSRVITIPDPGADSNLILSGGNNTLTGVLTLAAAASQLVLRANNAGNTMALNMSTPGQNMVITLPDPSIAAVNIAYSPMGRVKDIAAADSVTVANDGDIILVNPASAYQITLPTPVVGNKGLTFTFIVSAVVAFAVTLRPTGDGLMNLIAVSQDGAANTGSAGTATNKIIIGATAAIGDKIHIMSTGAAYIAHSVSAAANKITAAN